MRRLIGCVAILALTAACTVEEDEAPVELSLACQLEKCVCVHPDRAFYEKPDPQPVLWKDNGDAYCPEGLVLEIAAKLEK